MTDRWLLDVNVLLALVVAEHVHHESAVRWFDAHAAYAQWATTPLTEAALVRLLLNARVFGAELAAADAIAVLTSLRAAPGWSFLPDDSSLAEPSVELSSMSGHRQVNDFHLLNLAVAHEHTLVTFDRALPTYLVGQLRERVLLVPVG
jgi:toxin-antitoxin system PIN domain toxin